MQIALHKVVPSRGLEPPPGCPDTVLNRARLPFRHKGMCECDAHYN